MAFTSAMATLLMYDKLRALRAAREKFAPRCEYCWRPVYIDKVQCPGCGAPYPELISISPDYNGKLTDLF